ncbi:MAG TPA: phosphate/phosphite/phosphonate ABC transporter substrate-binding protein [Chitinophagaceae bacterium]
MNISIKKIIIILLPLYCFSIKAMASDTLRFATYTYSTNNRLANLQPLAEHLSKKIGRPVVAVSYPTVPRLIEAILHDSVDLAMMNTSGYLVLQRKDPAKVSTLVNLEMNAGGVTNYATCLIAAKEAGITSLDQLVADKRKLKLALVGSSSTSGNLVPRLMLNARNISSAEQSFDLYYAGTHRQVVKDVIAGKATIGGCGCAEIDSAKANNSFDEKAVVIASYNDIPLGPIVYNSKLKQNVVAAIKTELLQLSLTNTALFKNFCAGWTEFKEATRFKPVTDKDYDAFRKMFGNNGELWKLIE